MTSHSRTLVMVQEHDHADFGVVFCFLQGEDKVGHGAARHARLLQIKPQLCGGDSTWHSAWLL